MNPNPFARRVFRQDTPVTLVKVPEAPPEIEKYKPYLVQKPTVPDVPGQPKPRKVIVEKIVQVPATDDD